MTHNVAICHGAIAGNTCNTIFTGLSQKCIYIVSANNNNNNNNYDKKIAF